ncbi:MAG: hypothetical protein HXY30_03935 [Pseudorhodoplanes sp.]|nr:hypothetical protein [Pseudorhodoplanes sp.]
MHPERVTLTGELRALAVRLLAYMGGIACLAFVAAEIFRANAVVSEPAAKPDWVSVERPIPAFMLSLPEIGEKQQYEIRRHERGGGRKDIVTFGEAGRTARFASVEIYRPGAEIAYFERPSTEIVPHAIAFDRNALVRPALPLETKFGSFFAFDIPVGGYHAGHCIGFVRATPSPRLQISGLFCNRDSIVDRSKVACMLDRLTLLSAGSDQTIAGVFAKAEINRQFCQQRDPLLYATPRKVEPKPTVAALKLRGAIKVR